MYKTMVMSHAMDMHCNTEAPPPPPKLILDVTLKGIIDFEVSYKF